MKKNWRLKQALSITLVTMLALSLLVIAQSTSLVFAAKPIKPLVSITTPSTGSTVLTKMVIPVSGTASSPGSGISVVKLMVDSGNYDTAVPSAPGDWSTWSASVTISAEGSHKIVAKAYNNNGNFEWARSFITAVSAPISDPPSPTPPPPTPPPPAPVPTPTLSIAFSNIVDSQVLSGSSYNVVVTASDINLVSNIKLYIDNVLISTENSSPYEFTIDTTQYGNTNHVMKALATDTSGNSAAAAASITVNILNPVTAPPPQPTPAADLPASMGPILSATSLNDMFDKISTAGPGQWVELANGNYDNPTRRAISKPGVIIKAQTIGGVTITGQPIDISGSNVWFYGFKLHYAASGDTMFVTGADSHILRNTFRFTGNSIAEWLVVRANDVEVAYNDFGYKTTQGTFVLHGTGTSHYIGFKMHHNYFHHHTGPGTPAEAYRIGSSQTAWIDFQAEVYNNLFEHIDGETELVTNKGSGIYIHDNTFIDCNSSVTLRHGNNNRVENNVFMHAGLRIYGHGHIVRGNQIIDDPNNQLRQSLMIGAGTDANDSGSPGVTGVSNSIHAQVRNAVIENNIIVNTRDIGSLQNLQLGFSTITAPFPPIDNTIRDNIIYGTNRSVLTGINNGASWSSNNLSGNIMYATGSASRGTMPSQNVDPLLLKGSDGIYRFTANSPLVWTLNNVLLEPTDVGPEAT